MIGLLDTVIAGVSQKGAFQKAYALIPHLLHVASLGQETAEEEELWHNLEMIQGLTEAVRTVAAGISQQLYQMPNADILALPADWASTHVLWP